MGSYIGIDPSTIKDHSFMAEELLSPMCNQSDAVRLNMFNSHVAQTLVLDKPEFPKVFTGFENQIGQYSDALKVADKDYEIRAVIEKNSYNTYYVLVNEEEKEIMILYVPKSKNISEDYGYLIKDCLVDKDDIKISKGDILFHSSNYDDEGNFMYGANMKVVYLPLDGLTYEDGIVISESAAKKLETTSVYSQTLSVNNNDILINLYGDKDNFKSFPNIGESINNSIICARRRIDHKKSLLLTDSSLMKVNFDEDTVFYSLEEGIVTDIEIFSNMDLENLKKSKYNAQIVNIIEENTKFYNEFKEFIEQLILEGYHLNSDSSYYYRRCLEMTSPETVFKDEDHSEFDNVIIKFTIEMRNKLCNGCKISGRYGNKGTIAGIYPDDQMPYDEDGNHVDIALNNQGVVNRLNSAQLNEVELNYASDYVVNEVKKEKDIEKKFEKIIEFLDIVNHKQAKRYSKYWKEMDNKDKKEFIKDIEKNGLYLHCPPFFDTPNFETLFKIYDKYGSLKPKKFFVKDANGDLISIDNPLIASNMYMIRLKHDSISKFSARSGGALSLSGVPSKNNKNYKEGKARYSKTAVRIGEMELINLFISNNIKEVHRFISQYSSNADDRKALSERLLGIDLDHFKESVFDINKVELTGKKSLTKMMLDQYLSIIGMKLTN